jgi:hypothetical protein
MSGRKCSITTSNDRLDAFSPVTGGAVGIFFILNSLPGGIAKLQLPLK